MNHSDDLYGHKDNDTYSYKGWLISDDFWKRAVAVFCYASVGGVTTALVLFIGSAVGG